MSVDTATDYGSLTFWKARIHNYATQYAIQLSVFAFMGKAVEVKYPSRSSAFTLL